MTDRDFALDEFCRLDGSGEAAAGASLDVRNAHEFVNIRCDAADVDALDRIGGVLGQALPLQPNTVSSGQHRVYWLGPDEWLVKSEPREAGLVDALRGACAGVFATFVDVSDGQVVMVLSGPRAAEVLAKGCTLDLHPDRFEVGDCAQTTLARTSMLISRTAEGFEIIVRRSFAEYAALWLRHAAGEFGFHITGP